MPAPHFRKVTVSLLGLALASCANPTEPGVSPLNGNISPPSSSNGDRTGASGEPSSNWVEILDTLRESRADLSSAASPGGADDCGSPSAFALQADGVYSARSCIVRSDGTREPVTLSGKLSPEELDQLRRALQDVALASERPDALTMDNRECAPAERAGSPHSLQIRLSGGRNVALLEARGAESCYQGGRAAVERLHQAVDEIRHRRFSSYSDRDASGYDSPDQDGDYEPDPGQKPKFPKKPHEPKDQPKHPKDCWENPKDCKDHDDKEWKKCKKHKPDQHGGDGLLY